MNTKDKSSEKAHSEPLQQCNVVGSAFKTFRDVYQLPFHRRTLVDTWIYDEGNNFCFQFEQYKFDSVNQAMLEVINDNNHYENFDLIFTHENGEIKDNNGNHWITIRGWGNLTSPNCLGLSPEEAANIQDSLADYIVQQLNFRAESC